MISVPEGRRWCAAASIVALACLRAGTALANGRFPGADQLVVDPNEPNHLLVRTTFGFLDTRDGGKTWSWICEESIGRIGTADPPIAVMGDGTLVVGVPFEGVAVSHDSGCSWSRAPAPLADQLVVDVTLEPGAPSSLLVLTSTNDPSADPDAGFQFITRVVETNDDARTWSEVGVPLPRDFIAATIEVAPSDRQRLYLGGVAGNPSSPVLETSTDRGATWTRSMIPTSSPMAGAYVSAVDPRDPDRLWVRLHGALDPFGMAPTTLVTSGDRGSSWTTVASTAGSMFGFALSPDGSALAYGTQQDGVFVAPTDGSAGFTRASALKNRCLTWSRAGLYACATEPIDPFSVGRSSDTGRTFEPLYRVADTCPQACADDSSFGKVCRASWTDPSTGIAALTGAMGEACTVPWAKIARPDAGGDGSASADARDAGGAADAGPTLVAAGGCTCSAARRRSVASPAILAFVMLATMLLGRRRTDVVASRR